MQHSSSFWWQPNKRTANRLITLLFKVQTDVLLLPQLESILKIISFDDVIKYLYSIPTYTAINHKMTVGIANYIIIKTSGGFIKSITYIILLNSFLAKKTRPSIKL